MNDWWKSPVLQGPENDYGQYDYMIEKIPENKAEWSRWWTQCSYCGKNHYLNITYTAYFHTLDGWDSIENYECWVCYLKDQIARPFKKLKRKIKQSIKVEKEIYSLKKACKKENRAFSKETERMFREILAKEM